MKNFKLKSNNLDKTNKLKQITSNKIAKGTRCWLSLMIFLAQLQIKEKCFLQCMQKCIQKL